MVVIAKNVPPKFYKEQLSIPDECCYKSCEDLQFELHIKDSWKISSHIETSQLIFKANQLAGFCVDDKIFR